MEGRGVEPLADGILAITAAPSTTRVFSVLVLDQAYSRGLEGSLLCCRVEVDEGEVLVLGQLGSLRTRHWELERDGSKLEELASSFDGRELKRGRKEALFRVVGSFVRRGTSYAPCALRTPPPPGTPLFEPDHFLLERISADWPGRFYLGYAFGTRVGVPFSLRHFGPHSEGGWGEAQFTGIFGGTGSGKSVFAASMAVGFARHRPMSVLLVDPKGEFYDDKLGAASHLSFSLHALVRAAGKRLRLVRICDVALSSAITFARLLLSSTPFPTVAGLGKDEAVVELERVLVEELSRGRRTGGRELPAVEAFRDRPFTPDVVEREIVPILERVIRSTYVQRTSAEEKVARLRQLEVQEELARSLEAIRKGYFATWLEDGRRRKTLQEVLAELLEERSFLILDMSKVLPPGAEGWSDGLEDLHQLDRRRLAERNSPLILRDVLLSLQFQAESLYRRSRGKLLNCLVVIDEAHQYAPREVFGDTEEERRHLRDLRATIRDTVRMARKMGLGMAFISQTTTSIDGELFKNLHNRVYGFGMLHGADAQVIREHEGDEAFEAYSSMPNPKQTGRYGYLVSGPIVALGSATGSAVLIEGFGGDEELASHNGLDLEEGRRRLKEDEAELAERFLEAPVPGISLEAPPRGSDWLEDEMPI